MCFNDLIPSSLPDAGAEAEQHHILILVYFFHLPDYNYTYVGHFDDEQTLFVL